MIFRINAPGLDAATFCQKAKDAGVWMLPFSRRHVRAVHLHITQEDANGQRRSSSNFTTSWRDNRLPPSLRNSDLQRDVA
ncbi:MAG: hypothetical protein R3C03_11440 [Pirellulaceae bacterium]